MGSTELILTIGIQCQISEKNEPWKSADIGIHVALVL